MLLESAISNGDLAGSIGEKMEELVQLLKSYIDISDSAVNIGTLTNPFDLDTLFIPMENLMRFRLAAVLDNELGGKSQTNLTDNGKRNLNNMRALLIDHLYASNFTNQTNAAKTILDLPFGDMPSEIGPGDVQTELAKSMLGKSSYMVSLLSYRGINR